MSSYMIRKEELKVTKDKISSNFGINEHGISKQLVVRIKTIIYLIINFVTYSESVTQEWVF